MSNGRIRALASWQTKEKFEKSWEKLAWPSAHKVQKDLYDKPKVKQD